uniref:Uncharacterized protein n=1 Tax=Compsopogon caeruleus TaxID=31354 RepID=A0A7S1THC4_9RHOD|mmetsp:Transcript_6310/g.12585  ORF Transcript_6310/g.12585 Transcript_6310/m.12585 type:complete len:110 (+) Transcript_6310:34-363(+)
MTTRTRLSNVISVKTFDFSTQTREILSANSSDRDLVSLSRLLVHQYPNDPWTTIHNQVESTGSRVRLRFKIDLKPSRVKQSSVWLERWELHGGGPAILEECRELGLFVK